MQVPAIKHYFSPRGRKFVLDGLKEILETGSYLTMGKYCEKFEEKFAKYVNTKFAVTTNSGTSALEMIFRALKVHGYEVIIPTNTFAATAFAVINAGGKPIFVDCTDDLTVDPQDVKRKLTNKTKAVVTVHLGGLVSPHIYELMDLCKEKGVYLVEDAAHAHGSMLDNKKAGTFGVAGAFSFFATKVMTTGEGGMIVTDDKDIYQKAMLLRNQAKVANENYHEEFGYNWRMTEMQALMGLSQLEELEGFIKKRTEIARIYGEEFDGNPFLSPLEIPRNVRHNFYKYIVFTVKELDRDVLKKRLKEEKKVSLGGYVYDVPCHMQPVFKQYANATLPTSEDLCRRHICPPIYVSMTNDEAHYVVESLKEVLSRFNGGFE